MQFPRPLLIAFDPRACRHAYERSRTATPHGAHDLIDRRKALAAVGTARVNVEFGSPRRDTCGCVKSDGFGGDR